MLIFIEKGQNAPYISPVYLHCNYSLLNHSKVIHQ